VALRRSGRLNRRDIVGWVEWLFTRARSTLERMDVGAPTEGGGVLSSMIPFDEPGCRVERSTCRSLMIEVRGIEREDLPVWLPFYLSGLRPDVHAAVRPTCRRAGAQSPAFWQGPRSGGPDDLVLRSVGREHAHRIRTISIRSLRNEKRMRHQKNQPGLRR